MRGRTPPFRDWKWRRAPRNATGARLKTGEARLCSWLVLFAACAFLPVFAFAAETPAQQGSITPVNLRCDGIVDPVGIDSAPPRLSWKLLGEGRALKQTAYRILVATSPELLARERGDVWDSGRVSGDEQLHIAYAGRPLASAERVFWTVKVWDQDGVPSSWSEPATWTMGLLEPAAWEDAAWIGSAAWLAEDRPHLGYKSEDASDVNTPKWIQLDLGRAHAIDEIKLHALRHTVAERLGFPRQFLVEVSNDAAFTRPVVIADTRGQPANTWLTRQILPAGGAIGRYARVSVPQLRELNGVICLAFNQIEVLSGGRNVAIGATVTAGDSVESGMWSASAVVDGRGVPGNNPLKTETVLLRRAFTAPAGLARATAFVCGLGQYTMEINGERVGDAVLSPGWTDTTKTCLYDSFDVTGRIRAGANAVGLALAGGMHNVPDAGGRYTKFVSRFRPLRAIARIRLEFEDGSVKTIVTDEAWKTRSGPITYSHVYGGEDYDARLDPAGWTEPGFDDSDWMGAVVVGAPGGVLRGASHAAPELRMFDELKPVGETRLRPGVTVYDLGQNASLVIRLAARGPAGSRVRILPAELINEDGSVDRASVGGNIPAWWQLTLAGNGKLDTWTPDFFYHGARYLQVETMPAEEGGELPVVESIAGLVTHSSAAPAGTFHTSDALFDRTRALIRWAQRSNLVSVMTDCPHRERLGWLEQYHLNGPSLRYEFDLARLYMKTFGDMADAQTEGGLVPSIAPEYIVFEGGFRDSPEWGSALILAAWQQYLFTGDDAVFRRHYDAMVRYCGHLERMATDHILDHGLGDWHDLGPTAPGVSQLTPIAVTATATYYEDLRVMTTIARRLGRASDAEDFERRAAAVREAFNRRFFDAETGSYAAGSQTANAMASVLGLPPDGRENDVLEAIVADIRSRGNALTSGDVGHRYLLLALARGGRSDVIFDMHHEVDRPGYGYQLARGATSLTEAWNARRHASQNHFMLGHIMEWFYQNLAGIGIDPAAPGFENVIVEPQPVGDIEWVEAKHESPRGPIRVRWERDGARFRLEVSIPPNASATIRLPAEAGSEIAIPALPGRAASEATRIVAGAGGRAVFDIPSGSYVFESQLGSSR